MRSKISLEGFKVLPTLLDFKCYGYSCASTLCQRYSCASVVPVPTLFLCQSCSCVSHVPVPFMFLCQLCFCASHVPVPVMFLWLWIMCGSGSCAALDYMRLWVVCGSGLYAVMDRIFVRGRESKVCGYNDRMICPCVKEHKLAPTEVENRRIVGSWLKDLPIC